MGRKRGGNVLLRTFSFMTHDIPVSLISWISFTIISTPYSFFFAFFHCGDLTWLQSKSERLLRIILILIIDFWKTIAASLHKLYFFYYFVHKILCTQNRFLSVHALFPKIKKDLVSANSLKPFLLIKQDLNKITKITSTLL